MTDYEMIRSKATIFCTPLDMARVLSQSLNPDSAADLLYESICKYAARKAGLSKQRLLKELIKDEEQMHKGLLELATHFIYPLNEVVDGQSSEDRSFRKLLLGKLSHLGFTGDVKTSPNYSITITARVVERLNGANRGYINTVAHNSAYANILRLSDLGEFKEKKEDARWMWAYLVDPRVIVAMASERFRCYNVDEALADFPQLRDMKSQLKKTIEYIPFTEMLKLMIGEGNPAAALTVLDLVEGLQSNYLEESRALDEENQGLQQRMTGIGGRFREAQKEVSRLRNRESDLQRQVSSLDARLRRSRKEFGEMKTRHEHVATQSNSISKYQTRIASLEERVKQQAVRIGELEEEAKTNEQLAQLYGNDVAEKEAAIANLQADLERTRRWLELAKALNKKTVLIVGPNRGLASKCQELIGGLCTEVIYESGERLSILPSLVNRSDLVLTIDGVMHSTENAIKNEARKAGKPVRFYSGKTDIFDFMLKLV